MSTMPFCMTNIWLVQPLWFKDFTKLNHVYRLCKVIYGLKQAPKAWYWALKLAIIGLGFHNSISNLSIFIYSHNYVTCYLLVYVDDLVITSNNICFHVWDYYSTWQSIFFKRYEATLFFLGIKVISTKSRICFCLGISTFKMSYLKPIWLVQKMSLCHCQLAHPSNWLMVTHK